MLVILCHCQSSSIPVSDGSEISVVQRVINCRIFLQYYKNTGNQCLFTRLWINNILKNRIKFKIDLHVVCRNWFKYLQLQQNVKISDYLELLGGIGFNTNRLQPIFAALHGTCRILKYFEFSIHSKPQLDSGNGDVKSF